MEFISSGGEDTAYYKWVGLAEHDIKVVHHLLDGELPCNPDNLLLAYHYLDNTRKKSIDGKYKDQINDHLSRLQDRIHHLLFEFATNEWREIVRQSGKSATCLACGAQIKNARYRTIEFRDKTSNLWKLKFSGAPMGPGCIKNTSDNPFRLGENYAKKK